MGWGRTLRFLRNEYSSVSSGYSQTISHSAKLRDRYRCQICGKKYGLSAHHILYRRFFPGLKNSINNMITLCWKCHKEAHSFDFVPKNRYEEYVKK